MAKNLVIVESPAKAKTIEKILGADFTVESSYGHIADLPESELGVDVDDNFAVKYVVSERALPQVKKLKSLAQKAETVWLASDEDREGEAISWHLMETLELSETKTKRIVFNSITKSAIERAINHPRKVDLNLVDAQQARRVLDRIVGYELSPVLWKKVKPGLSAGRVQSVAVRLVVEREREIQQFTPEVSFKVNALFQTESGAVFKAKGVQEFDSYDAAEAFLKAHEASNFTVTGLEKKPAKKSPAAPFTTSTLQQEASRKLYFPVRKTMQVAQRLYESGLITYMRTDSVNLSPEAVAMITSEIESQYGADFVQVRTFTSKSKGAQEAHEAIRPTQMANRNPSLSRDEERLYELIYKRSMAALMSDAQLERTKVNISGTPGSLSYLAQGEVIVFEGFLKVYLESTDDEDEEHDDMLPPLAEQQPLQLQESRATERYSRAPYRYSEASLVKKLEELGIGRPSTYAATITRIIDKKYVEKGTVEGENRSYRELLFKGSSIKAQDLVEKVGSDKGKLVPTDIGFVVNDFLVDHFASIVDYHFTAEIEERFDEIAEGKVKWRDLMHSFYGAFHPTVEQVQDTADRASGERYLGEDPQSGRQLIVRLGRFGPMAQIGSPDDDETPKYASLLPHQSITSISYEEALDLFKLPRDLGEYEGEPVQANVGRFGPYIRYGKKFASVGPDDNVFTVSYERALEIIAEKEQADAPIYPYQGHGVSKGKGRFGPFIKWNNLFINVNKNYNFDQLSNQDIEALIEEKLKKEAEKLIKEWPDQQIRIEKARWGRFHLIKGKQKVELAKEVAVEEMSLEEAQSRLEAAAPKKAASKKSASKKPAAKKSASKK
ncbi:MAG: type I DNA topoisomerase [Flavobacteriaceae bacterium]